MLALAYWEAGLCRKCGQHLEETTDPAYDQDRPETSWGWAADGPDECFACKALHLAEHKRHKESPDSAPYEIWSPVLVAKRPRVRRNR